jgi:bisphosphoglycerate-dependent phosphoglycerate mutase
MGMIEEKKHQQEENNFVFRLHLVRHGETEANRAEIVLGQIDSPLTNLGIQQARAAHRSILFCTGVPVRSKQCLNKNLSSRTNCENFEDLFFNLL